MDIAIYLAEKFGVAAFIGLAVLFDFKFYSIVSKRIDKLETKHDSQASEITTVRLENEGFYANVTAMKEALDSQKTATDSILRKLTEIEIKIAGGD